MPRPEILGTRIQFKPRLFYFLQVWMHMSTSYWDHKDHNGRLNHNPDNQWISKHHYRIDTHKHKNENQRQCQNTISLICQNMEPQAILKGTQKSKFHSPKNSGEAPCFLRKRITTDSLARGSTSLHDKVHRATRGNTISRDDLLGPIAKTPKLVWGFAWRFTKAAWGNPTHHANICILARESMILHEDTNQKDRKT